MVKRAEQRYRRYPFSYLTYTLFALFILFDLFLVGWALGWWVGFGWIG